MYRTITQLAAAAFLSTAISMAGAAAAVFDPETFTLSNGLQVVVVPNHRAPVATHMVWYKAGAADEMRGKSGIAHFLEHLMFKGTEKVPPGEFSKTVARNGGNDNAFTSWDYTAYFQNVAIDRLELVMRMEADRMRNLRLSDAVVLPERDVILEERRQVLENNPEARLREQMMAALFLNHPYGTPIIGWREEMAELTTEDALAWYRRWYAPNNAILVVAGDITAKQLRPLAEKYYGPIPSRPMPVRARPPEPKPDAERRVVLRDPQVRQPSFQRLYLAPSYNTEGKEHAFALQVLAEIVGAGSTGRLYRDLVIDQRVATGAGLGYSPVALDLATLGIGVTPAPGTEMSAIEAALDSGVATLLARGVTHDEVADARQRLVADAIFARDSLSGPARVIGSALATGRSIEDVEAWPDRINEVTVEQVNAAAREVFGQPFVTGYLLPTKPVTAAAPMTPAAPAIMPVPGALQPTSVPATLPAPAPVSPSAPGTTAVR